MREIVVMNQYLSVSPRVQKALKENKPVVALESTIISHGMPYPQNVETALNVEKIIEDCGAVPATIAIINGKLTVGCTKEQIDLLGKKGLDVIKTSRRDIPFVIAKGEDGATTVAATMFIASLAGIKVFATGGIGGVHRGAETTMDISADLEELQQTSVMVVCAGAKSILDLGLTLECLETRGVAVVGYRTEELPAFYTQKSGFKVDYRLDTPAEIALAFYCQQHSGLKGGMLVTNPIPDEYAMDSDYINTNIDAAVKEAESLGIHGKESTPFLLDKIQRLTSGKSLAANIQLVYNNARLASEIAKELAKL
ncbi:MAG: pseudouridine-5'-phosphate glycosidase [Corallococcus sp.]|nr:pseudouridine-5'-phosphate glycosidase [Corallococcus sp.]